MNSLFTFILSLYTILGALQQGVPFSKLDQAFDANNAEAVVALSRDKVVIKYAGKEGIYSKPQAVQMLKEYFIRHPKGAFDFTFKGAESEGGTFAIGNYCDTKIKHRITVHFKNGSDGYKIESITIE